MVHREGLGDVEEADELEPVESLGAGLVGVDLWESGVERGRRRSGRRYADRTNPRTACNMVLIEESRNPASFSWRV